MVSVEIPVWRLRNGQKVAGTTHVQVLSSIANDVKEIFTEIYNGPEQFPIESVGGYNWRSNGLGSNHSSGTAIDINPTQIRRSIQTVRLSSSEKNGSRA